MVKTGYEPCVNEKPFYSSSSLSAHTVCFLLPVAEASTFFFLDYFSVVILLERSHGRRLSCGERSTSASGNSTLVMLVVMLVERVSDFSGNVSGKGVSC